MEQNEHEMTLRKEELQFSLHYQYSQEYDLFNNPFREFNRKRKKTYLGYNVLCAAQCRISYVFDNFQRIYVSFSGGKDSTVLFHLCAAEARKRNRKFGLLFIDWECQYKLTIDHVTEMVNCYSDVIELYWCCLPMKTVNAVSVFEPEWIAWEKGKEWIREKPECAIKDGSFFRSIKKI